MVQPQKVEKIATNNCKEEVLFNSDTLSKIVSYLPSVDLLNLALTCTRFGISDDDELSVIKMSADIIVHEIATEEQLAALPHYEGESSLADYHYLQLMREPLMFDQLVDAVYVNTDADKSCVKNRSKCTATNAWGTTFSNNIMRAGKHYVTFEVYQRHQSEFLAGIMRPGQANQNAHGALVNKRFYQSFSQNMDHREHGNTSVDSCTYYAYNGSCYTSDWGDDGDTTDGAWDGMESMSSGDEIGMLLNLDEGTLSVYKNGRKLGIMKGGLAGPYCWVASFQFSQVTIKRGTIP